MVGSIASFEAKFGRGLFLEARCALGNPIKVFLAILNHFFREISAVGGKTH